MLDEFVLPGDEDGCIPLFHMEAVKDVGATNLAGRPVFREVPYVKVLIKGSPKTVIDREVKEEDKGRWPQAWNKFLSAHEGNGSSIGTPLEELPGLPLAERAALEFGGVKTVEELLELSDEKAERLGFDAGRLHAMASAYVDLASGLLGDGGLLMAKYAAMQEKIAELEAQVAKLEAQRADAPTQPSQGDRGRTNDRDSLIQRLDSEGVPKRDIAEAAGCSVGTVRNVLRRLEPADASV